MPREDLGDSWYSPAFDEDASKPKIGEQVLNGILIGAKGLFPQPELCEDDPDSHETIHPDEIAAAVNGTAVDIRPAYLPEGVELEMQEARACQGQVINLVRGYVVESRPDPGGTLIPAWAGGGITISRTLTSKSQFSLIGVAERVHAATIGGYPAVLVEPLTPLGYDIGIGSAHIVVRDGETVTSIEGDGLPFGELLAIAESLWIDK